MEYVEGPEVWRTTVARIRDAEAHPQGVRIDRRTKWGNPFRIGADGNRAEVIGKFRRSLAYAVATGDIEREQLAELHGRTLLCHCAPQPCHGHVLAEAAAWAAAQRPGSVASQAEAWWAYPLGSPERQAILDAMRARTRPAGQAVGYEFSAPGGTRFVLPYWSKLEHGDPLDRLKEAS